MGELGSVTTDPPPGEGSEALFLSFQNHLLSVGLMLVDFHCFFCSKLPVAGKVEKSCTGEAVPQNKTTGIVQKSRNELITPPNRRFRAVYSSHP